MNENEVKEVEKVVEEAPKVVEEIAKAKPNITSGTVVVGALALAGVIFVAKETYVGAKKLYKLVSTKMEEKKAAEMVEDDLDENFEDFEEVKDEEN